MPIEVACPSCTRLIRAPDKLAGKKVKCPDCHEVVAVPASAAAAPSPPARPASGPAPVKPPRRAPPAPPRPNRPGPPPALGVGDLLEEINSLEQAKSDAAAEAEYERQQREASLNAYLAPMHEAKAKQSQSLHSFYLRTRIVDMGFVVNRTWELYGANLLMLLVVCWFTLLLSLVVTAAIQTPFVLAKGHVTRYVDEFLNDPVLTNVAGWSVLLPGTLLSMPFAMWLSAGQTRYLLKLARGEPAEFADVFRGAKHIGALMGASCMVVLFNVIYLVPSLVVLVLRSFEVDLPEFVLWLLGLVMLILFGLIEWRVFSYIFFHLVIVDRSVEGGDSLTVSHQIMAGNSLRMALLCLFLFVLALGTVLTACTGFLFFYPFGMLLVAVAYVDITAQVGRHLGVENVEDEDAGESEAE